MFILAGKRSGGRKPQRLKPHSNATNPGRMERSCGTRNDCMRKTVWTIGLALFFAAPLTGQGQRLWVLRSPGEMVEYDPATFAVKQTVKVPPEAVQSPQDVAVNRLGQILFEQSISVPLTDADVEEPPKVWFWNGKAAITIDQGVKREGGSAGSNQTVSEIGPMAYLAEDGAHLFWFANKARRLQREDVDLSTTTTWQAWQTDLTGGAREDIATSALPDCRCPTGACEESCPYGVVWLPDEGVGKFFLMTQFVAGKTEPLYKATVRYQNAAGKWTADPQSEPLQRVLDAASGGSVIVEAIPDTGCCGWSNQSNDQTLLLSDGKKRTVFDERSTYQNPDYDVSFYTSNARLSPELGSIAMTIVATAQANKPIQLAQDGQANPEESQRIRKALAELPAVEVKSMEDPPKRIAFFPHAALVGWISEKELLIVEDHVLVVFNVATAARRKSSIRVEDVARVFLR